MIQATPIKSGDHATRYYAGTSKEAVLLDEKREWMGKGAEILGLSGQVTRDTFSKLSRNLDPMTGQRLTVRTKKNRKSWYDICFDVPKSVSIYLAETNDKVLEKMIWDAFIETMTEIEKCMCTQVKDHSHKRVTGNMVYAAFIHRLSRPVKGKQDPQFHIHCTVGNATYDEIEKRWKAGEFGPIVTQMPLFEKMFNEKLMNKFNAIGMRIRRTAHAFELDGVTRQLIEKFSKRWKQVGQQAKRLNKKILNSMRERKPKVKLDEDELRRDWRVQMTETERRSINDTYRHSMIHRSVMLTRMIPKIYEPYKGRDIRVVTPTVRAQNARMGVKERMDIPGMDR